MKHTFLHIAWGARFMRTLLPALLLLPLLAACSSGDDSPKPVPSGGVATVRVQLSTADAYAETGAQDTEEGTEHEFIHSLTVLIVNQSGTVVKRLAPDLSGNSEAKTGDLKNYISEAFSLDAAEYTVYAFANMDAYTKRTGNDNNTGSGDTNTTISSLIDTQENNSLPKDIDNIVLDDPAGTIDFTNNHFIPMSAKEQVSVTASTTEIDVALDRLVSKIRMKISAGNADMGEDANAESTNNIIKVKSISFGGYADKVSLFDDEASGAGGTSSGGITITNGKIHTINYTSGSELSLTVGGEAKSVVDFYVNATSTKVEGFDVTVETDENNGTMYTATTSRTDLPRNSIFPLTLTLHDFTLDLEVTCWVSPIGHYPVEVDVEKNGNYNYHVPEGAQVELNLEGIKTGSSTTVSNPSCTWTFDKSTVMGFDFDEPDGTGTSSSTDGTASKEGQTVKGHVTASMGSTIPLTCAATWTENDNHFDRTYTVNLIVDVDLKDVIYKNATINHTRAVRHSILRRLGTEILTMTQH